MSLLDNIQNYYEPLVLDALVEVLGERRLDEDVLTDVICVALNHLPPRYYRYEVDMVFYLSPVESEEMQQKVKAAVVKALAYVEENHRK